MLSWMKPYRPDPFKFRPTRIKRWLYWFFYLQNQFMMRICFRLGGVEISPESRKILKHVRPGTSTLIVANHINFADPHVTFHLAFVGGYCHKWLAGIEPFDSARGISGWFIQSVGAFSVDRGILDRFSLETAQKTLVEAKHPLVVYPEGEANYTHKVIESFYPGACQFALNALDQTADPSQPVQIVPVGLSFRFATDGQSLVEKAMAEYATNLSETAQRLNLEVSTPLEAKDQSVWQRLLGLIEASVTCLEAQMSDYSPENTMPLEDRMLALRDHWLNGLYLEHYGEAFNGFSSQDELMMIKNKLRSLIARKRHAPSLEELVSGQQQAKNLSERYKMTQKCNLGLLRQLEHQWIGDIQRDKPVEKRLKQLEKHLQQQKPFAEIRAAASEADCQRWDTQMNQTRQIKMLTLLVNDIRRCDTSWEALEESLVKLEILVFNRFCYRGPKRVEARVASPLDVRAFAAENAKLGKKALLELLNNRIRQQVADLVDEARLEPPIMEKALLSAR